MKIRVFEAFAGYGSQSIALEQLKTNHSEFDYEVVGISEIDRYAIKAYNALHQDIVNYGDICLIDWTNVPDFDCFTYSFPCTNISMAGRMEGFIEGSGTSSSLLWECRRAILAKKPKYLLLENVPALINKTNIANFNKWVDELASYGYTNSFCCLNAKDFGVPQNRNRLFMVSILNGNKFEFPKGFYSNKVMRDILEQDIDDRYYIKRATIEGIIEHCKRKQQEGCGFRFEPTDGSTITKTINTREGSRQTDNFIIVPAIKQLGNIYPDTPKFKNRTMGRIYDVGGLSPTINCCGGGDREPKIFEDGDRIRKLTPRECFRLQGVNDKLIDKIQATGISNTQQYKLAGNSIVVNVLYYIFLSLFTCSLEK
jgi:DNA (cytosine-5)-methyltransferase 1